ncbi:substrate-binding periplasmic protein [Vibrio sp. HN007]|uniref:substrate-binding periplasmic protein n=1 Tax=Vibrio iocasae TaxID=3098914 RepID=UPI0035D5139B
MKRLLLLIFSLSMGLYNSNLSFASEPSKKLTLAAVEWKPMNSPEFKSDGYLSEIVRTALSQSGYTLDIEWAPWNRVLEVSKAGGYDGILVASYKKDREEYFEYSHKIGSSRFIFWQRSESSYYYSDLDAFSSMRVGVLLGSNFTQDLKNHGEIIVDEVSNIRQNILKLAHGRIDVFLVLMIM